MKSEWRPLAHTVTDRIRIGKDPKSLFDSTTLVNLDLLELLLQLSLVDHLRIGYSGQISSDASYATQLLPSQGRSYIKEVWPNAQITINTSKIHTEISALKDPTSRYAELINQALRGGILNISQRRNIESTKLSGVILDTAALIFLYSAIIVKNPDLMTIQGSPVAGSLAVGTYALLTNSFSLFRGKYEAGGEGQPLSVLPSIHPERHVLVLLLSRIKLTRVAQASKHKRS